MSKERDTILCIDKEDAKRAVDSIGCRYIDDFEFLDNGKVRILLNCKVEDIKEQKNEV